MPISPPQAQWRNLFDPLQFEKAIQCKTWTMQLHAFRASLRCFWYQALRGKCGSAHPAFAQMVIASIFTEQKPAGGLELGFSKPKSMCLIFSVLKSSHFTRWHKFIRNCGNLTFFFVVCHRGSSFGGLQLLLKRQNCWTWLLEFIGQATSVKPLSRPTFSHKEDNFSGMELRGSQSGHLNLYNLMPLSFFSTTNSKVTVIRRYL